MGDDADDDGRDPNAPIKTVLMLPDGPALISRYDAATLAGALLSMNFPPAAVGEHSRDAASLARIEDLLLRLLTNQKREEREVRTLETDLNTRLDNATATLQKLETVGDGLEHLVTTLVGEVAQLKTGDPVQDQKVDDLTAAMNAKITEWSGALAAGTPADPGASPADSGGGAAPDAAASSVAANTDVGAATADAPPAEQPPQ